MQNGETVAHLGKVSGVDLVAPAARALHGIHGGVGALQEVPRVDFSGTPKRDSHACGQYDLFVHEFEWRLHGGADFVGQPRSFDGVVNRFQQDHELVAGDSRNRIGRANVRREPLGELLQGHVSDMMAESVVDRLQTIEVQEHDRDFRTVALATRYRLIQ